MCLFFFSSRRRHTRCLSDWSSDVCSSDLASLPPRLDMNPDSDADVSFASLESPSAVVDLDRLDRNLQRTAAYASAHQLLLRSEERRVGKVCVARIWHGR